MHAVNIRWNAHLQRPSVLKKVSKSPFEALKAIIHIDMRALDIPTMWSTIPNRIISPSMRRIDEVLKAGYLAFVLMFTADGGVVCF